MELCASAPLRSALLHCERALTVNVQFYVNLKCGAQYSLQYCARNANLGGSGVPNPVNTRYMPIVRTLTDLWNRVFALRSLEKATKQLQQLRNPIVRNKVPVVKG